MMQRPILLALCGAVGLATFAQPAAAKWRYFRSPHFELYADGSKGQAQDVLNYLEQVRDVFGKLSQAQVEETRPVRVVAFSGEADFKRLHDRGESPYALYTRSRDRNYIVFRELNTRLMYEVAVHEYVHLRATEIGLTLPFWLSEGLAEFYSTMRPQKAGIQVGLPTNTYKRRAGLPSLPIEEVIDVDFSDPKLRKDRNRVLSLYARSWALTSMVATTPEYSQQFGDLLSAITAGEKSEAAFEKVYGTTLKDVGQDLEKQMNRLTIMVMSYDTEWDADKQELEQRDVDDLEADLVMADLLSKGGKPDEARQAYAEALTAQPDNPEALYGVARLALDDADALAAYERAMERRPTDPYVYLDYALLLLEQDEPDTERVLELLKTASLFENAPDDVHLLLTAYAHQAGDHQKATYHLRMMREVKPSMAFHHYWWLARSVAVAGSQLQTGVATAKLKQTLRTAEQLAIWEQLTAPDSPGAFQQLEQLEAAGKADETAGLLMQLGQEHPFIWQTYERLAARAEGPEKEKLEMAARNLRWEAAAEGRRGWYQTLSSVSLLDQAGFHELSQEIFDSVLLLTPNSWELMNNRAYQLAEGGYLLSSAVELAERAAALEPDDDSVKDTLGWVYVKAGRFEEAVDLLLEASRKRPDSAVTRFHCAEALAGAGQTREALQAYDEALNLKPTEKLRREIEAARAKAAAKPVAFQTGSSVTV